MIGDKLKERRAELGMTQAQVAELTGIKKNTISNYENNISSPSEENMLALMKILQCDANFLFGDFLNVEKSIMPSEKQKILKYRCLDTFGKHTVDIVLDAEYDRCTAEQEEPEDETRFIIRHSFYKASAGTGVYLPDSDNDWDEIEVPDTPEARKADYALTIQGDSMEPVYFDGDIVLVKQCDTIDLGQIGIFVVDGEGYIKKFGGDRLISLNDKYNDIELGEYTECRCMGKVIGRISR